MAQNNSVGSQGTAGTDNGCSGLLTSGVLTIAPDMLHPEAHMSERERTLLNALSRAHAEIRELQTQVHSLLSLNLRYAEELRHALTSEPPRKRPHVDTDRTESMPDSVLTPSTAQVPRPALGLSAPQVAAVQSQQALYLSQRLRTPSYPQAIAQSLSVSANPTQNIYHAMHAPRFQGMMAADGSRNSSVLPAGTSAANIQQLLVPASASTVSAVVGAFDETHDTLPRMTLADAAASIATMSAPANQTIAQERSHLEPAALHIPEHSSLSAPAVPPPPLRGLARQTASLGSLADAATASVSRPRALTAERLDVNEVEIGDPEAIPSIGKFSSPRLLYQFKERVQAYEEQHGSQWRERMDSKRRQNWSRISAVYTRILQLRGPGSSADELERALRAVDDEMAQTHVTLTKYSQVVRKQLATERRQTAQRDQQAARLGISSSGH
ncbi:hypothetical protein IW148_001989 [Coemansia sp. RSA 1199]|nr:hypothetical protein IW148_001989 [Coemansia sp. RSA 1199]